MNHDRSVQGGFVDLHGERYYKIGNMDQMRPFFMSVVSSGDHWLFVSSSGCLSAGRIRPENALFPYRPVDQIHENNENTGSKTIIKVDGQQWEPFNRFHDGRYDTERNLYKSATGDKLIFEEINRSLQLSFQYSWHTSEQFGFIRTATLNNLADDSRAITLVDGLQNILPSGAPKNEVLSNGALVDAYKWNERLKDSTIALFTMYARLSDRAEPAESLLSTVVFSLDDDAHQIWLSSRQLNDFRQGRVVEDEMLTRGVRGSFLIEKSITLAANVSNEWMMVADIDKTQSDVTALRDTLKNSDALRQAILESVAANQQDLRNLMAASDGFQLTNEETTSVHHYANVLFNGMRGGVIENNYHLDKADVIKSLRNSNHAVAQRHKALLNDLAEPFTHAELLSVAKMTGDLQFERLCYEYLPLTFGRRHGDPSRPWNHYEIKLKDDKGDRLLSYQGNWRDIFQNWEATALSYPELIPSFLSKFVNASTVDGYNPYRVTKDGIDWEVLEPENPWSNIGYWGDHQIIYLLKFLEQAEKYHEQGLKALLNRNIFSYANVPYRLCSVDQLFIDSKNTVTFDETLNAQIEQKVAELGNDARMLLTDDNEVYMVNLTEKVLVPLLAKLSNLVLDGGIWLNTQRPEWNDANNAIVGNGLSMVTLYYMRRYVTFLQRMLAESATEVELSHQVCLWMRSVTNILVDAVAAIEANKVTAEFRKELLIRLAQSAQAHRDYVYQYGFSGKCEASLEDIKELLSASLVVLDRTIASNLREDGLYNAYNILGFSDNALEVETLYPMLEGQVSALSAGVLSPEQAAQLMENLFNSPMYREDQNSFILYPDRHLTPFMEKNCISAEQVASSAVLSAMLENDDRRLINKDMHGVCHFHPSLENNGHLRAAIASVQGDYSEQPAAAWQAVEALYETVFNHKAFTGRSGTMFGYEGVGSIYWHMVSKLLLAVQENYLRAEQLNANSAATQQLADFYYRVREGIGFNKTPENYGAFPTDPYSHTPKHAGAQQPGMTGQVKEEVITRFGELGVEVNNGAITIHPTLLRSQEFLTEQGIFACRTVSGETLTIVVAEGALAFTLCQVPFIYQRNTETEQGSVTLTLTDGTEHSLNNLFIPACWSQHIFARDNVVAQVQVQLPASLLLK